MYLCHMKIAPRHYLPLRQPLDLQAVRPAARHHQDEDRARLEAFVAAPPKQTVAQAWATIDALQQLMAEGSGNRVLQLMLRIPSWLTAGLQRRRDVDLLLQLSRPTHGADFQVWLKQCQGAVATAVLARDEDAASRAASDQFDQLLALLRQVKPAAFPEHPPGPTAGSRGADVAQAA